MSFPPPEIFKAYDIRGVVGKSLTREGVRLIGQALGSELLERSSGSGRPEIAVGRDGRVSGPELARALMEGIRASGVDVAEIGMFATPVAYFAAHELGCGSAVAVTGSHNPPEYNGLKMVLAGTTLAGEDVQQLRRRIESGELARGAGRHRRADIREAYLNRITSDVRLARPMKIAVDCGNGVAGATAGDLYRRLGCEVLELYCDVDGRFPNHHPDPSHPENLKDLVTRLGPLAQAGTVEQAIAFGDVVVMVVPYSALEEIGKAHGRGLATKPLVMDICNPIARRDGEAVVKWVNEQGGAGLASAKLMPGARIVRAFNAISYRRVGEIAHRPGGLVGVPIAGDDPKAIALAEGLIRGMGFEPVLVGNLAFGKYLVPGTPLAEEHTPAEIRQIAARLR